MGRYGERECLRGWVRVSVRMQTCDCRDKIAKIRCRCEGGLGQLEGADAEVGRMRSRRSDRGSRGSRGSRPVVARRDSDPARLNRREDWRVRRE